MTKRELAQKFSIDDSEEDPHLTSCGIGSWRPAWLQVFANPIALLLNLCFVKIFQSMGASLLYTSISTLEKRYAFNSKISSLILISDCFTSTLLSPIVGYYAIRFNRSRLIGAGEVILGTACIFLSLPYFIYGPATHLLHSQTSTNHSTLSSGFNAEMCLAHDYECNESGLSNTVWPAVIILFVGNLVRGVGFTIYFTLVMPFMDDSVPKGNSPLYISMMHAINILGPTVGYFFSAYFLTFYEDPWNDPGISRQDPRFIGAWWMGFLISGLMLILFSLPLFFYPAQFKTSSVKTTELKKSLKESGGTWEAIVRLVQNPLVILFFLGNEARYLAIDGFYTFIPKYIESQYRQTSSKASMLVGSAGIAPIIIGIIIGGVYVTWKRPKARLLFTVIFLAEFVSFFTIGSGLFLGCEPIKLQGEGSTDYFSLEATCNVNCNCSTRVYTPICEPVSGTTYFSPCHAGCKSYNSTNSIYEDCSCFPGGQATLGYCPKDMECNNLNKYIILIVIGTLVSATAKTGNSLIAFRSVDAMDKSFVSGIFSSLLSLFAFIPGAVLYGYIVDSACLVWETKCGRRGNCWAYDTDKFRQIFLGSIVVFLALGSLFDFLIILYADRIKDLYGEEEEEKQENEKS